MCIWSKWVGESASSRTPWALDELVDPVSSRWARCIRLFNWSGRYVHSKESFPTFNEQALFLWSIYASTVPYRFIFQQPWCIQRTSQLLQEDSVICFKLLGVWVAWRFLHIIKNLSWQSMEKKWGETLRIMLLSSLSFLVEPEWKSGHGSPISNTHHILETND